MFDDQRAKIHNSRLERQFLQHGNFPRKLPFLRLANLIQPIQLSRKELQEHEMESDLSQKILTCNSAIVQIPKDLLDLIAFRVFRGFTPH